MTPSGIEQATFRFLAQCLNRVPHKKDHNLLICDNYHPEDGSSRSQNVRRVSHIHGLLSLYCLWCVVHLMGK